MRKTYIHDQSGHITTVLTVVFILALIGFAGWKVSHKNADEPSPKTTSQTSSVTDPELRQGLQDVDSAMAGERADSTTADNGLNDTDKQITVPAE